MCNNTLWCVFVTWEHVLRLFAVCSPEVPPVGGLWPGLPPHSHCLRQEREDTRAHHRALPSHLGAERVYKGRNTDGSSVSVVKSSTTELRHVCRHVQVKWLYCSRIYRLIRGTVHHTLRSISSAGQRWNYWVWGGTLQEFPVFPNDGTLQDKTFLAWVTACKSEHSQHRTLQIMGPILSWDQ